MRNRYRGSTIHRRSITVPAGSGTPSTPSKPFTKARSGTATSPPRPTASSRHAQRHAAGDVMVVPNVLNSDHPGNHSDTGPSWVATLVDAVGESPTGKRRPSSSFWTTGRLYDHEPPPFFDNAGGLRYRVPMLVVSPSARRGGSASSFVNPQNSRVRQHPAVHRGYLRPRTHRHDGRARDQHRGKLRFQAKAATIYADLDEILRMYFERQPA